MPLPKGLARLNRSVSNKVMMPLASRLGGFAVLEHKGRNTGRTYRTPVNVFADDGHLVVALTYGSDVDWLKNVRAAEGALFVVKGEEVLVGAPLDLSRAEGYKRVPRSVQLILAALDVSEFVAFPILEPPT